MKELSEVRAYSEADWQADNTALVEGYDAHPCPRCDRRGFYAPRLGGTDWHYRACKFCGLRQTVGGEPLQMIRYECDRDHGWVADWKLPGESWECPECRRTVDPDGCVEWPSNDANHPWNRVPTQGSQADYQRYWKDRGVVGRLPFGIL